MKKITINSKKKNDIDAIVQDVFRYYKGENTLASIKRKHNISNYMINHIINKVTFSIVHKNKGFIKDIPESEYGQQNDYFYKQKLIKMFN